MHDLSADARRKYSIIAAIVNSNTPTLEDISIVTAIPVSTLKRQISQIRNDLGMDIRFTADSRSKGRTGHYHIYSWGILDRTEFMLRHGAILEK